jgi:hypothetical protein
MGVWDKRFFKDYFPGLLQNKGSKLNIMTLMADKTKKEICMRNSNFLGKESFA